MGWGYNFRRRVKIFMVALTIYLDYKAVQKKNKWIRKDKQDSLWEKAHERNAKRVLNAIIELEGLWVKLGQYLSTRADVLPDAYLRRLKQLQDSLPPRPLSEVYRTIEKELGKPADDLFLDFDETPLATASIAQVHRARLKDGREVVVKVQHEGIKGVILQDLKNARTIVEWIAWAEPEFDFGPMIEEWCNEAPKELDFNKEADNTRKVAENLDYRSKQNDRSAASHVDVLIPEVIQSSEKVLVLEYMDGVRLNDGQALEALGVNKQALVELITRAYAHQIYVDGFFNGDPHPGNFLVSKEPPFRPILLDFGLTKSLSSTMKQALAKLFLACAEADYAALLSAFSEMGLKLRLDMPEEAMAITNIFFRSSTPAKESLENLKALSKERDDHMKSIQEKMQKKEKEKIVRRNPVDAFPSDAVIFIRVLNLLRGLSSMLDVRIVYLDIMRPFAESTLLAANIRSKLSESSGWIYDTPVLSEVEAKLRQLLLQLGQQQYITGIQVCAYKDGNVIIDTAGGTLGKYDPRPVQPDSLFSVFSATKAVTAGLVHWLVDKGKLSFADNVGSLWPDFAVNGKESCKVAHVLNHTAGLHNAMADVIKEDPFLMCDWDDALNRVAAAVPESAPGSEQKYHSLSFGWLCGGIIEMASSGIKTKESYEINSQGVEIFSKSWLPKSGPIRGIVCFCHGYGDTCTFFFEGIGRKIAASGYGVFAMDYPGFGLSAGLHGYIPSFEELVDAVIEHYAKVRAQSEFRDLPCFIFGQSMGGAVALKVHLKQPHEWDGTILVAPMCKIKEDVTPPRPVLQFLAFLSCILPKQKLFPQKDMSELAFRDPRKRKMAAYNVIAYKDQLRLKTAMELLKTTGEIENQLQKVSSPLLILHGAADRVTDPSVSKALYENSNSSDKTLQLYDEAYHSILEGEPDEIIFQVFDDMISWLDVHCNIRKGES